MKPKNKKPKYLSVFSPAKVRRMMTAAEFEEFVERYKAMPDLRVLRYIPDQQQRELYFALKNKEITVHEFARRLGLRDRCQAAMLYGRIEFALMEES